MVGVVEPRPLRERVVVVRSCVRRVVVVHVVDDVVLVARVRRDALWDTPGLVEAMYMYLVVSSGTRTHTDDLPRILVVEDLPRVHEAIRVVELVARPDRYVRVHSPAAVVAGEDGVEVDEAPVRGRLRARQPVGRRLAVLLARVLCVRARGVGVPDVDAGAVQRRAGRDVDDLQREPLVHACLPAADVLPVCLAVGVERAPDDLGREHARGRGDGVAVLVSEERLVVCEGLALALGRLVVVHGVPLVERGPVWKNVRAGLHLGRGDARGMRELTSHLEKVVESLSTLCYDAGVELLQLACLEALVESVGVAGNLPVVLDHLHRSTLRVSGDAHCGGSYEGDLDKVGDLHRETKVVE